VHQHQETAKREAIQALLTSPPVGQQHTGQHAAIQDSSAPSAQLQGGAAVRREDCQDQLTSSCTPLEQGEASSKNSFANITQMGVSNTEAFPTLGGQDGRRGISSSAPSSSSSAWGGQHPHHTSACHVNDGHTGTSSDTGKHVTKKKGKGKGKFVSSSSLLATSSVGSRSYR
jgi:hypothetical protein